MPDFDPNCTSKWLFEAYQTASERDCVDAYYDALALADLLKERMDSALKGNG
jgi:hypothetical protein